MLAQHPHALFERVAAFLAAIHGEFAGVLAGGIARAADKAAITAELEPQPPGAAGRAQARIAAVSALREEMRPQILIERVDHIGDLKLGGVLDRLGESGPELLHHLAPIGPPAGDVVELFLQPGGEAGIDIALEEAGEKGGDQPAAILGHEALLIHAHIIAITQHGEDRGVGGGAADAELFHLFHQRRFREARRRLGEMLRGGDLAALERVFGVHRRQHPAFVALAAILVVAVFAVELEEAVEGHDRAGGAQHGALAVDDIHQHLIEFGRLHLRGDGAFVNQLIEPQLLGGEAVGDLIRRAAEIGRAHRFVGFLGVFRLAAVFARVGGEILRAEGMADLLARGLDRLARHLDAVGSHIGDQTDGFAAQIHTLIESLRDAHGLLRAQPELAAGFLLQGGGGERGRRVAADALFLDLADAELAGFDRRLGARGVGGGGEVEFIELFAVELGEAGGEGGAGRGLEMGGDIPIFARLESLDLGLALTDQPQRDRLDAPGGARSGQLAPQHRGEGEAHQIIQRAAGQIGLDQRHIQIAGVLDRGLDRAFGDFIEGDAAHHDVFQRLFVFQHRLHVPGDGLPFAIRIGGEIERVGALERTGDGRDLAGAAIIGLPIHGEILIRADAAILGRQIAHMAETGQHRVIGAQIFVDGLGFGG